MVPVGVLKRKGSNKKSNKSVMFCDGIAPGSDLTHLDQDFNYNTDSKIQKSLNKDPDGEEEKKQKKEEPPPPSPVVAPAAKVSRNQPKIDEDTGCFIPKSETSLPPTISVNKTGKNILNHFLIIMNFKNFIWKYNLLKSYFKNYFSVCIWTECDGATFTFFVPKL